MASDKKSLKQLLANQAEIQSAIEAARAAEIENVQKLIADKAAEFGYDDVNEFLSFLGYRTGKAKTKVKQSRPRLTANQRDEIKAKFVAGAKVPDIRKEYGISYSTANNLKKEVVA